MTNKQNTVDVGSADPELNTSPIADETNDASEAPRQQIPGEPVCYFNNMSFDNGEYIKSGTSILKCDYGIWVPTGSSDPDNP